MKYQKIINLLDNTQTQPTKFRKKNWVERNDDSRGMYNANLQIKFKTSMFRSSFIAWKVSKYGVISSLHIPAFGLNTEIYGVIQSVQIQENTHQKYFHIWTPFTQCLTIMMHI